nr:aminotransferase class V-fold PLP-dependent enzyme [Salsipaludibacter albus]
MDLDWVRARFPALQDPDLADWVHAQNAGGSWMVDRVADRLDHFQRFTRIQGGTHFPAGAAQQAAMDAAAPGLARWLGVGEDEVHVGPSTSALTYALGRAFAQVLGPGDAVVVTDQDHEANSGAWRRLADTGVEVREWQVDPDTGRLDPAHLDPLLDDDVALVAFPHVSNVVGEVNPVADVVARAHAVDAVAIVDGVAAAPHGLPDVGALGADVWLFSAYKVYGPHQGVMAMRRGLADRLPNQGHFFNADQVTKRFVPAGPDHAQVAALAGMVDYLDALADHHLTVDEPTAATRRIVLQDLLSAHESALVTPLMDALVERPGVRVLGPTTAVGKVPVVSFVADRPAADVAADLATHHVMASSGHFYAWRVLEATEIDPDTGVVRLSLVHYNTPDEVDRIVTALDAVLS